jgi:hypothetical protein
MSHTQLTSLVAQLIRCYHKSIRHKPRATQVAFHLEYEKNMVALAKDILERKYRPWQVRFFIELTPKPREIVAAHLPRPCGPPSDLREVIAALGAQVFPALLRLSHGQGTPSSQSPARALSASNLWSVRSQNGYHQLLPEYRPTDSSRAIGQSTHGR